MFNLDECESKTAVITDRSEPLNYGQVVKKVENFTVHCKDDFVFILCEDLLGAFVSYVACINKHIPQVLLGGSKDLELVQRLIGIYRPEYIWMPTVRVDGIGGKSVYTYQECSLQLMAYDEPLIDRTISSELPLCLATSRGTGSPELVRLSKRDLKSNTESIAGYLKIISNERPVTSLPTYYSYGMSVISGHLIKGATILLIDKAVIQHEFWTFTKEQKATSIASIPYTCEMLKRLRFFHMELPELKTAIQTRGKLNAAYVKKHADFARQDNREFIVIYGQTETAPRMAYLPFGKATEENASVGIVIPGGKLCIVDANGKNIKEPEMEGELVYKGENICLDCAEKHMDLREEDENYGELHTGDIAKSDADGFFYITGRMKRFVKIWSNRINLSTIEQLVKAITPSCAYGGMDSLITIFMTENGLEEKIKALLTKKTGFNPRALTVKQIDVIPIKTNGKIDYPELQRML